MSDAVSYGRRIGQLADATPDRAAVTVVARDGTAHVLTWRALDAQSNQLARSFAADGVGLCDRVALLLTNSVALVLGLVAAWKCGATPVPVRWDVPDWERARVLTALDPTLVVDGDTVAARIESARSLDDGPVEDVTGPCMLGLCSSGSTGKPKVILRNRPTEWRPPGAPPLASHWQPIPRPQRILVPAPIYHLTGIAPFAYLFDGDELVIMEKFDAPQMLDLIERLQVTTFTAATTMLRRMTEVPDFEQRDFSSIAWVLQGAATSPAALLRHWCAVLGADRVFMSYGMSENLGIVAIRGDEWLAHEGSVGRGLHGTEVRIQDDDGVPLVAGEVGLVALRSPTSESYEYLGGSARLPQTDDGFVTAGDVGYLDDDGFLYLVDRRTDLIVTGGANVYPAEVEAVFGDHPAIADVVVVGLPDDEWGHRVHAIVEPRDLATAPSADEVIAYAKARLAAYKAPKSVEFVDRIPRSEVSKVNRSALVAERGG